MAKTLCRFLAIAYAMVFVFNTVNTSKVYNIHWNASNPIFRIDKTDNIIDVNAGNHPSEYDQVNIVCPVYKANLDESRQERYIIYLVSKEEFKSCRISQQNPRVIAVCNRPYDFMYFTITFRSFTPTPGGLEFHPGQDYYFISTSTTSDLHRRVGGSCSSHNMKLIFKVAAGDKNAGKVEEEKFDANDAAKADAAKTEDTDANIRYHPWHLPTAPSHQPTEASTVRTRSEEASTSRTGVTTFYYPMKELEKANELFEMKKKSKNVNFNIYRGARKAFTMASSSADLSDLEIEITSSASSNIISTSTFIAAFLCVIASQV